MPMKFAVQEGFVRDVSPGCDCWSVVQSASAIVFPLTFAPVLDRVSALTPTPLLLSSQVDLL